MQRVEYRDGRPQDDPGPDPLGMVHRHPLESRRTGRSGREDGPPWLASLAAASPGTPAGPQEEGHGESIPAPVSGPVLHVNRRHPAVPFAGSLDQEGPPVARYGPQRRWNPRFVIKLAVTVVILAGLVGALHGLQIKRLRSALRQQARTAIEDGDWDAAMESLRSYAELGGDETSDLLMLADLLGSQSESAASQQKSIEVLEQAVEQTPESVTARRKVVQAALNAGEYEKAVDHLESLQNRFPDDVELRSFTNRIRHLQRRSAGRATFGGAGGPALASAGGRNFGKRPAPPSAGGGGRGGGAPSGAPARPVSDPDGGDAGSDPTPIFDWKPTPPASRSPFAESDPEGAPVPPEPPVPGNSPPADPGSGPNDSPPTVTTPEPSSMALMVLALLGIGGYVRHRRCPLLTTHSGTGKGTIS